MLNLPFPLEKIFSFSGAVRASGREKPFDRKRVGRGGRCQVSACIVIYRCPCVILCQCMDGACMRGARVAHGFGCVCVPQVMGRGAPMGVCAACICGIELMR